MCYLLHVRQASGSVMTVTFASDVDRSLFVILLRALPLELRLEDVSVSA